MDTRWTAAQGLRRWALLLAVGGLIFLTGPGALRAQPPKVAAAPAKEAAPALPSAAITPAMWKAAPTGPLQPGEIDRLLSADLSKARIKPAPRTTDEQFLRRVWLDLTGSLPMPADLSDFLKDQSPDKRAKVIDRLLESKSYARHWGRYWRQVIESRVTDNIARVAARPFETWMTEQLQANRSWAEITRTVLTATGEVRFAEANKSGPVFFLMSRRGADAVTERAAEASRIFLGVQIQCAQCHDHPSDVWKRQQFHEFAAYFARLRDRPIFEEKRLAGFRLVSTPFGEYQMPARNDPKKRTATNPRFLDGKAPGKRLSDSADTPRRICRWYASLLRIDRNSALMSWSDPRNDADTRAITAGKTASFSGPRSSIGV